MTKQEQVRKLAIALTLFESVIEDVGPALDTEAGEASCDAYIEFVERLNAQFPGLHDALDNVR